MLQFCNLEGIRIDPSITTANLQSDPDRILLAKATKGTANIGYSNLKIPYISNSFSAIIRWTLFNPYQDGGWIVTIVVYGS